MGGGPCGKAPKHVSMLQKPRLCRATFRLRAPRSGWNPVWPKFVMLASRRSSPTVPFGLGRPRPISLASAAAPTISSRSALASRGDLGRRGDPCRSKSRRHPPLGVRPQRRAGAGSPAVLFVRLTKEQYDALSERAALAGVPTSAMARDIILTALGNADGDRIAAKLEEVLRRTLSPELLAS